MTHDVILGNFSLKVFVLYLELKSTFMSPQSNGTLYGNNERAVVLSVSSFVLQQKPLSMLLCRHPINIRKYGL